MSNWLLVHSVQCCQGVFKDNIANAHCRGCLEQVGTPATIERSHTSHLIDVLELLHHVVMVVGVRLYDVNVRIVAMEEPAHNSAANGNE